MKRAFFYIIGWLGLILVVVSLILPIIPATPFFLLAAYGFSKSSARFHNWLISLPKIGPLIVEWESQRTLTNHTKWLFTSILVPFVVISLFLCTSLAGDLIMAAVTIALLIWIWTRKSSQTGYQRQ